MDGQNQLQIYTGDGKGKTTASIGLSIRMLGNGGSVGFVQFDKGHDPAFEHYAERKILRKLDGLKLHPTGLQRFDPGKGTFRFGVTAGDRQEATRGIVILREFIDAAEVGLLVADELCTCLWTKLLNEKDVLGVVDFWEEKGRPFELLLTGRNPTPALLQRADLISEMKKVKHYFDRGLKARQGIEF